LRRRSRLRQCERAQCKGKENGVKVACEYHCCV
jgi:hypothetical protein